MIMKKAILLTIFTLTIFYASSQTLTPSVVSSAGASQKSGDLELTFTVGEVAITTLQSGDKTLTQGFHQQNVIVTSIYTLEHNGISISAFPNPVENLINIRVTKLYSDTEYQITIFDMQGKQIQLPIFENDMDSAINYSVNVTEISKGQYIVAIIQNNVKIATVNFIKN